MNEKLFTFEGAAFYNREDFEAQLVERATEYAKNNHSWKLNENKGWIYSEDGNTFADYCKRIDKYLERYL